MAVVTIFRSRLRPGVEAAYEPVAAEMEALGRAMPGFVDLKTFVAADGERVSITVFADEASQRAWREHPRHREAQRRGRDEFYAEWSLQVCTLVRERRGRGVTLT